MRVIALILIIVIVVAVEWYLPRRFPNRSRSFYKYGVRAIEGVPVLITCGILYACMGGK